MVTVWGYIQAAYGLTPGSLSRVGISLPVASNLTETIQCVGNGWAGIDITSPKMLNPVRIIGNTTNDEAVAEWYPQATVDYVYYHFSYVVL